MNAGSAAGRRDSWRVYGLLILEIESEFSSVPGIPVCFQITAVMAMSCCSTGK